MKKFLPALFLLILLTLLLASCGSNGATGNDTETAPVDTVSFAGNGVCDFTIVYPDDCSKYLVNQALTLRDIIENKFSVTVKVSSDFIMKNASVPVGTHEILVGPTNRAESLETYATIADYSYAVKYTGGRIVLAGSEEGMLAKAVGYFIENYINASDSTISIPENLNYTYTSNDYSDKLALSVNGATRYSIVYCAAASDLIKGLAKSMENKLLENKSVTIKSYSDSKVAADANKYEIVLDYSNRPGSYEGTTPEFYWIISVSGNRVFIDGSSDGMTECAVGYFISEYINKADGDVTVPNDLLIIKDMKDYSRDGWLLAAPAYDGGRLGRTAYNSGAGMTPSAANLTTAEDSYCQTVSGTTAAEYTAYLEKLKSYSYRVVSENTIADNIYTELTDEVRIVYTYYIASQDATRIIVDNSSVAEDKFEYTYTASASDTTTIYQYSLRYEPNGEGSSTLSNCGMLYLVKLADNRLIVIDGGSGRQTTTSASLGLYKFMKEITGTSDGEKIRIACWYFTHAHSDHVALTYQTLTSYKNNITLERMMFNMPSFHNYQTMIDVSRFEAVLSSVAKMYPELLYIKCHTGQNIQLADAAIEVLYTHEDTVDAATGLASISNGNSSSTVIRITAGGVSWMLLGDLDPAVQSKFYNMYPSEILKSDIVQIAHHAFNKLDDLYKAIAAKYALFPQAEGYTKIATNKGAYIRKLVERFGATDLYFADKETTGLTVRNGQVTVSSFAAVY